MITFTSALVAASVLSPMQTTPSQDESAWNFLREAERILLSDKVAPKEGGSLPTTHGRQYFDSRKEDEKECVESWASLEKSNYLAFVVRGGFVDGKSTTYSTMSGHHQLDWAPLQRTNDHFKANSYFHETISPQGAERLYASGKTEDKIEYDYAGDKATVYFRAVYAKPNSFAPGSSIFHLPVAGASKTPVPRKPLAIFVLIAIKK